MPADGRRAVVSSRDVEARVGVPVEPAAGPYRPAASRSSVSPVRLAWYWRLVAWVVAVPLGLAITAIPVYDRLVTKDDILDVFIRSGISRYARLAAAVAIWALVTAVLVQLFVEGSQHLIDRRRAARQPGPPRRPGPRPVARERVG